MLHQQSKEVIFYFIPFNIASEFKDIFHSLDVWHKAKSIRKSLAKVSI